jgi:SRSO17 transposase
VQFQTKPEIALAQIRQAVEDGVAPGVVLADEVYGSSREFRDGVAKLKLDYSLAVRSTTTVWALERQPLPPKPWKGKGRRATRMRRDQRRSEPNPASFPARGAYIALRPLAEPKRRNMKSRQDRAPASDGSSRATFASNP